MSTSDLTTAQTITSSRSIISNGVDIVSIERIDTLIRKFGESVVTRLFTRGEIEYSRSQARSSQHFAARWAAKEATMKALPPLNTTATYTDIGVGHDNGGAPELTVADRIADRIDGPVETTVSLSHDRQSGTAIAQVFLLIHQCGSSGGSQ